MLQAVKKLMQHFLSFMHHQILHFLGIILVHDRSEALIMKYIVMWEHLNLKK